MLKKLAQLTDLEVLVYLNRWAKHKDFYKYDRDRLYEIINEKLFQWLKTGDLKATSIIQRKSPAHQAMQTAIDNEGEGLYWLNGFYTDGKEDMPDPEKAYYKLLSRAVYFSINVKHDEETHTKLVSEVQADYDAYLLAKAEFDQEIERRKPIYKAYHKELNKYKHRKEEAAIAWAEVNNQKIKRSKSGKNRHKKWLKDLHKKGFSYREEVRPFIPFKNDEVIPPEVVELPAKTYEVSLEDYRKGMSPEFDRAYEWGNKYCNMPEDYGDFNDNFLAEELEENLSKSVLRDEIEFMIIPLFLDILDGKYPDSKAVYDALTAYPIGYQEIGMYSDTTYSIIQHERYGDWHKNNLGKYSYWLVELESQINPDVTFHMPYQHFLKLDGDKFSLENIPSETSEQMQFGRIINEEEIAQYPIKDLVRKLGYKISEFPGDLESYSQPVYCY